MNKQERNGVWFPEDGDSCSKTGEIDDFRCSVKVIGVKSVWDWWF